MMVGVCVGGDAWRGFHTLKGLPDELVSTELCWAT